MGIRTNLGLSLGQGHIWPTAPGFSAPLPQNIIQRFFDGAGIASDGVTVTDTSGNGNNGALLESHAPTYNGTADVTVTTFTRDWDGTDWRIEIYAELNAGTANAFRGIIGNRFGAGAANWWTFGTANTGNIAIEVTTGASTPAAYMPAGQGIQKYTITKTGRTMTVHRGTTLIITRDITDNNIGGVTNELRFGRWVSDTQTWNGFIFDAKIFDGAGTLLAHWPGAEGSGTTLYEIVAGKNGTVITTDATAFWANTQNTYHYNINYGFQLSGAVKIPYGAHTTLTNPAGAYHNGAETKVKPNPLDTAAITTATGWDSSTALAYADFKTQSDAVEGYYSRTTGTTKADRHLVYSPAPTYLNAVLAYLYVNQYDELVRDGNGQIAYDGNGFPMVL